MSNATVLLLGSGGREHALAWKLVASDHVDRLICAPGNPGMASLGEIRSVDPENSEAVVALAHEIDPDLVVVGAEAPIAAGVSDALRDAGFLVFAPSKAAGRLEWDKSFSKEFMKRHNIPTAAARTFDAGELEEAKEYLQNHPTPIVLKASGLAAGKGVVIADTTDEALDTIEEMLSGEAFGDAGTTVVIEEFMVGEEASIFAVTDGTNYVLLAPSQDHKRIGDGDTGPNTGGMGAYAPVPIVTDEVLEIVRRQIVEPTLQGMREEGTPYTGCLFVGLMIADGIPRVVEFNSRFGDPETQVILPLYRGDLYELFLGAAAGDLSEVPLGESTGTAVCVVIASEGYPESYEKGKEITGADADALPPDILLFHAGTGTENERLLTAGGRVFGVTAVSEDDDLEGAIARAYDGVRRIAFDGAYYRRDIGAKSGMREEIRDEGREVREG